RASDPPRQRRLHPRDLCLQMLHLTLSRALLVKLLPEPRPLAPQLLQLGVGGRLAAHSSSAIRGASRLNHQKPITTRASTIPSGISSRMSPPIACPAVGAPGSTTACHACWTMATNRLHMIRC